MHWLALSPLLMNLFPLRMIWVLGGPLNLHTRDRLSGFWFRRRAWFPVRVIDGGITWLTMVDQRENIGTSDLEREFRRSQGAPKLRELSFHLATLKAWTDSEYLWDLSMRGDLTLGLMYALWPQAAMKVGLPLFTHARAASKPETKSSVLRRFLSDLFRWFP